MKQRLASYIIAMSLSVVLLNAATVLACGPFTLEAIFVHTVHPSYPVERFARGEIGVIQPSYARSYLYVAYRHLAGLNFTQGEQKALSALWHDRLDHSWNLGEDQWIKAWLGAREKVKDLPEPPKIEVYRDREKPNEYESYLNCQKDAFDSAIKTLDARIAKYGSDAPVVRNWIEAQDQVFANCSGGQHIPAALDTTADPRSRADRAYQIAAANFYSTDFDKALETFEEIALDNNSPWQSAAPYLIARTLIRKASLGPVETRDDSLGRAESKLNKILKDNKETEFHPAASRLLNLVRLRLHPSERLHELAQALMSPTDDPELKQDLWDYTVLLDQFLETGNENQKPVASEVIRSDDLTDWITTVQDDHDEALSHALARWQQSQSPAWLIATLSKVNGKHAKASELIAQALRVQSKSSAFASARFHAVRLLIETGKIREARNLLDELLKTSRKQFDESSLNLLLSQRLTLAGSLTEFLTYAPRVPASVSWNDDGREIPAEASELSDDNKSLPGKPLFDADAANILNRQLPLSVLKEAARSSLLPANLKRDVAQAAWLRAVLLGDNNTADELVPTVKEVVPDMSRLLDDFVSASDPEAKRFSAVWTWLKFPGLEPVVDQGVGRESPLNQQDMYRDNWWCGAAFSEPAENQEEETTSAKPFTADAKAIPAFLSAAERQAGSRERATLDAIGAAPNYLCRQVVEWGTKNPNDPRVPEALHLAVNSTRHGCTDKETGRWSKAAFDLLHRRYPTSSWAKKTPYWFKD